MSKNLIGQEITRRRFLGFLVGGIAGAVGVAAASQLIGFPVTGMEEKQASTYSNCSHY